MSGATTRKSADTPAQDRLRFQPMGAGLDELLSGLMARAEANMTDEELRELDGSGIAAGLARQLGVMADGVGWLIASDAESTPFGARCGALRSVDETKDLLFLVANVAQLIGGLLSVETHAINVLASRERASQMAGHTGATDDESGQAEADRSAAS